MIIFFFIVLKLEMITKLYLGEFSIVFQQLKNIFCLFQKPGEFNWSAEQQSIILGSFFYGYVLTQVTDKY